MLATLGIYRDLVLYIYWSNAYVPRVVEDDQRERKKRGSSLLLTFYILYILLFSGRSGTNRTPTVSPIGSFRLVPPKIGKNITVTFFFSPYWVGLGGLYEEHLGLVGGERKKNRK
jgi:hypothetical protein